MSQYSQPWDGSDVGHAASRANYLADEWDEMYETWFGSLGDNGIIPGVDNELAVAVVGANTVSVDTGCAMARGKWYRNTVIINDINVPSATAGNWREDCICLRVLWAAKTVTVERHENDNENVAWDNADLNQTHGTTWEIPLGNARVTDAGVVTLYDNVFEIYGPIKEEFILASVWTGLSSIADPDWDDLNCAWRFDPAAVEYLRTNLISPRKWRGGLDIVILWMVDDAVTPPNDGVYWAMGALGAYLAAEGDSTPPNVPSLPWLNLYTLAAGEDDTMIYSTMYSATPASEVTPHAMLQLTLARLATDASDDYPNDAYFYGAWIRWR